MNLRAQAGVAEWVRERGGPPFVWTATHRCCTGPLTLLEASADRPRRGIRDFRPVKGAGSDLFIPQRRRQPQAPVIELDRRRRRVSAYWTDLASIE